MSFGIRYTFPDFTRKAAVCFYHTDPSPSGPDAGEHLRVVGLGYGQIEIPVKLLDPPNSYGEWITLAPAE